MPAVSAKVESGYLVIHLPLESKAYLSKTGRSEIIATTDGFKKIEAYYEGRKISVNVTACVPPGPRSD